MNFFFIYVKKKNFPLQIKMLFTLKVYALLHIQLTEIDKPDQCY